MASLTRPSREAVRLLPLYQAFSPDKVALVQWTESIGLTQVGRDQLSVQMRSPGDQLLNFTILQIFLFAYERKGMGIIVCGI